DLKRLEDQGIIKTLTDKLVLGSAIVTIGGGIMTGLRELTGFVSKFAQAATDINTIRYYVNEGQKNVASWRNTLNINMQKQEAKNYDPDAEEDRLRYMFEHYIHGQEAAKDQIMSFFTQFGEERKAAAMGATTSDLPAPRVLIFNGPSGTGKTFMAELLCAGVTPIDPYIITASDILKASNSNPAAMPYSFFYGNTQNGGNNKDDFSAKNNLISFLQATQGSVRVIIIDEWDKIYKKDISGNWPIISPLEETLRDIVDNRLTDYNGAPVDLNGAVFIFTTNETTASLQGRIQIDPITGDFIEALVDENGDPILDQDGEQVYGKPKRDSSRTQTLVPHDGSLMARLSGSICYFDKLNTNDYEIIARDALGDDRNIKTVDDYIKAQRPSKVSLEKRLTTNIGGVIITDKGYRMIAEYASKMTNAARSIVGAGGNKTGSVSGTLDTAIIGYVAYLKNTSKSCKDLVLLAEPYETKNSTGRKTIQFRIKPVGYLDDEHTYEQYFEKCNNE
ncbi:MAG: AAA family ATPase, partial [Clostridia bacterium]|nr:AAA family ATPase [Clostridia bacterium]